MCKYFKNVLYRIIQIIWMNYVDIFVRISKIVCINQDFYPNHLNHTIFYPNHVIFLSKTNSEIIRTDFFFFWATIWTDSNPKDLAVLKWILK